MACKGVWSLLLLVVSVASTRLYAENAPQKPTAQEQRLREIAKNVFGPLLLEDFPGALFLEDESKVTPDVRTHLWMLRYLPVVSLGASGDWVDDDAMLVLTLNPKMQSLEVHSRTLTAQGISYISGLRRLRRLTICDVNEGYFRYAVESDSMEDIEWTKRDIEIQRGAVNALAGMERLEWLTIHSNAVDDSIASAVAASRSLELLDLYSPALTANIFKELLKSESLQHITIAMPAEQLATADKLLSEAGSAKKWRWAAERCGKSSIRFALMPVRTEKSIPEARSEAKDMDKEPED